MESDENATVMTANDLPKADEIAAAEHVVVTTTTAETKPSSSTVESGPVVVDREPTVVATTDAPVINSAVSVVDVDELSVAMASATVVTATDAADDVEQNQGQVIDSEENLVPAINQDENVIVNDDRVDQNECELQTPKETEDLNSTMDSVFEDAREYINEESFVEKDDSIVINAECPKSSDGHDENGEELLVEKSDLDEDKASAIPVPVDDDTNDPQYIPRRGRFYEHDDRMAYSTSSENTDSDNEYDDNSEDDGSVRRLMRRRRATTKMSKTPVVETTEKVSTVTGDGTSKRVLAISKVAGVTKNVTSELTKTPGRKSRDVDSLDKWTHDMYDEREQMPKTQDELLVIYGYDIRNELEAPRARRHHKYGRTSTAKYNRNWQDTTAYNGIKTKRRDLQANSSNKNKNKSTTTDNYTTEFPTLNKAKPSESTAVVESPAALEACSSHRHQQAKSVPTDQEKKFVETGPRHQVQSSRAPIKHANVNNTYQQKQQNGVSLPTSSHNKNMFNRPSMEYSAGKEKDMHMYKDFYNRKSSRNFNFNQPQFNRDRNFTKASGPMYNLPQNNILHAGTGRTLHSSGGHYNDRQYENENQQITPPPTVVRSSKRYSVQSRRELPNPVLNFGGMPKTNQPQQQISMSQPNGLVMQEPTSQIQQQQQPIQIHQPPAPQIQIQPYQQLPQLHHGMVLDHNSSMMVMSDSSIYHHLYAGPQYSAVTPGQASASVDDQNAAALQMLATQAVVYHPGATSSSPQPPPETFMTTFYQPQQQSNKQLPPRRMNLAIPIVAPPESNQSQSKTMNSSITTSKN